MTRQLYERDAARTSADNRARAVLDRLHDQPDDGLAAAMVDYFNNDGPAWSLPPGEYLITRHDWRQHRTVIVGVFADKAGVDAELELLLARERVDRTSGKITRSSHYAVTRRG